MDRVYTKPRAEKPGPEIGTAIGQGKYCKGVLRKKGWKREQGNEGKRSKVYTNMNRVRKAEGHVNLKQPLKLLVPYF